MAAKGGIAANIKLLTLLGVLLLSIHESWHQPGQEQEDERRRWLCISCACGARWRILITPIFTFHSLFFIASQPHTCLQTFATHQQTETIMSE